MKVSTMAVPANTARNQAAPAASNEEAPKAAEPQDKVVKSDEDDGGSDIGNGVKFALGGAGGLLLTIPAMYAGVLGGAVVGSLFGVGFGPALASVTTEGALGFLGGVWQSTSTAAKIGMAVGGFSGLVGGWKMGTSVGNGIGRLLGAGKDEKPKNKKIKGFMKPVAYFTTGVGAASGGTGGTLIGAGIGATGSLLASGFSFSNLGGPALIGAAVGGLTGMVVGGAGGYTITQKVANVLGFVADKADDVVDAGKKLVEGEKKPQPEKAA
ncbi:MAG: hypothetical protein HY319_20555 [Armatimonadetes bacterium]|nr:hypothetical protein [Armatimonadota bacterium]